MTTNAEVIEWIKTAANLRCTHMLTIQQSNTEVFFPVYIRPGEDLSAKIRAYNGPNNQKVKEVIDLNSPQIKQLLAQQK